MSTEEIKKKKKLSPTRTLLIGILLIILIGAIILKLPISNKKPITFINSLFVSTSSVCVTGLTPVVICEQFSTFGQVVIMALIQVGGLRFNDFLGFITNGCWKKS